MAARYQQLLAELPKIAKLVNSFGAPEVQKAAFDTLVHALAGAKISEGEKRTTTTRDTGTPSPGTKKGRRKKGPMAHIRDLITAGFLDESRGATEIQKELVRRTHTHSVDSVSTTLARLTRKGELERTKEGRGYKYAKP